MRKIILLLIFPFLVIAQSSYNMNLLGSYEWLNTEGSDIWGWVDPITGNEYALLGLNDGFSCVNVTNPYNPIEEFYIVDLNSTWRDIKTWGHYAYITTEANAGLLIVDLNDMTGNTYWHVNHFANPITGASISFTSSHNLYIDENGIAYIFGARDNGSFVANRGVIFLDVASNATSPVYLGEWDDEYVHDGMSRGDTLYAGCIYTGDLYIIDVSDKSNPFVLGTHPTPNAFTHNIWVSDDGNYVFTTDEKPNAYISAFDISDMNNIQEVDRIQSNPGSNSIPHNVHVDGNFLITSYYREGTRVYDITYPENMIEIAYYDSYIGSGSGYDGCWGTYPFLPSGNIISSDVNSSSSGNGKLLVYGRDFQQASFLFGNITDLNTGYAINNASIEILNSTHITTTNLLGNYNLGSVNSGIFQVLVSAPGYIPVTVNTILTSGNITTLDIALTNGSIVYGCTDSISLNFNPLATTDDSSCFTCPQNGLVFSVSGGSADNEISWGLTQSNGWASASGSSGISYGCVQDECYIFRMYDTGGDGWNGATYIIMDSTGITLASGTLISGFYGSDTIQLGSSVTCDILGCTGPTYCNYNPNATMDDGSCWGMSGCMDSLYVEYNPFANCDDGSCSTLSTCSQGPPTGLFASNIIHNRATINWDNMNSNICSVDQYRIQYREVGATSWLQKTMSGPVGSCNYTSQKTEKIILNLTANTNYEYQMKAWYCGGSVSSWSSMQIFTTLVNCPNIGNLAVVGANPTKATFTWDASNGTYAFVRLKARVDSISNPTGANFFQIGGAGVSYGTNTKNKNGLIPGETYRGQARTYCSSNGGWKSLSWTPLVYWTQPTQRIEGGNAIAHLAIYPNPSKDVFNITFTSERVQDLRVRVLNVVGEEIVKEDLQEFAGEYVKLINLKLYSRGIYFLEIETNDRIINKKLILQ